MDFKYEIGKKIALYLDIDADSIVPFIEIPPDANMGDYSYPCFRLAKSLRKSPNLIAAEIADKLLGIDFCQSVEAVAAYVNFKIDKAFMAEEVLKSVLLKGKDYGSSQIGNGKTVVIDYSSPNIAKPLHIGHLRTTMIGNSIYKLHKFLGYNVVGINYLGDWGTQFGKMIVAIKSWGNEGLINKSGIKELVNLYVKFHEEAEKDPSLIEQARRWMLKMQEGDKETLDIWRWICDISIKELDIIYKRLNISFDSYKGESFYNDKMAPVVEELKEKGLLNLSDGAQVVNLEEYNMPPCLILRSDGGTLYPTRDIAAAMYRKENYDFDKCLYVTGLEQNLHFAQWFKVIELMGYDWAKDLVHISYGMVSVESGKLSTRAGNIIYMDELLNEAVARTLEIIKEKNPDLENKEEVAEQVGIGAIIFNDLYNSRVKDVLFSWDKMLNFEGETGPYVQYSCARAGSILQKAGFTPTNTLDYSLLADEASFNIMKILYAYPEKLTDAAEKYEPYILTRHITALAQAFNSFYHENPILSAEGGLRNARLHLVYAVREVLRAALALIGLEAPEKM